MVVMAGEKLHIITRRRFDGDLRRHFIGVVQKVTDTSARVRGRVYIFDTSRNEFCKKDDIREKIIGLGDSGLIINVIPSEVDIDSLHYTFSDTKRLIVSDGKEYRLDIHEFGAHS